MRRTFTKLISILMSVVTVISGFSIMATAAGAVSVVTQPTRRVFYEGIDWTRLSDSSIQPIGNIDISGTVLSYNSQKYSYQKTNLGPNMYVRSKSGSWKLGSNEIKIICDNIHDDVYASTTVTFVGLKSISVVKSPNKINLVKDVDWKMGKMGDVEITKFDLSGITINAVYTNGDKRTTSYPGNSLIGWSVDQNMDLIDPGKSTLYATIGEFQAPFTVYYINKMFGDVNKDSNINSYDALIILKYSVRIITSLTNEEFELADVNFDNKVNSADALKVLQYSVGLRETFFE